MKIEEQYPKLFQFFGSSFHQDWEDYFETSENVIHSYVMESRREWIEKIMLELKLLIKEQHTKAEWYRLLADDFGCEYVLEAYSVDPVEWLEKVQKQLEDELPFAKND